MPQETHIVASTKDVLSFKDLPLEIQSLIYKKYYEDYELILELGNPAFNQALLEVQLHQMVDGVHPQFRVLPSPNIERLNRQIRKDAQVYLPRTLTLNQIMTMYPKPIAKLVSNPRYACICGHIENIFVTPDLGPLNNHTAWLSFLQAFPRMKRLCLKWPETRQTREMTRWRYEKNIREISEAEHAERQIKFLKRVYRLQALEEALRQADRGIRIELLLHLVRRVMHTNHSFSMIMKASKSGQGSWTASCNIVENYHEFSWDDALPPDAITHEIKV